MRNLGTVQVPTEAFMAVLKLEESTARMNRIQTCGTASYIFFE